MTAYLWYFFIYAFVGWCAEVAFCAVTKGGFTNRGFLSGPVCPIYGCGLVCVLLVLTPIKEDLLLLYAGSVLLTSLIELVGGWAMEKLFHHRWWDYSDRPLNIGGYVCALFSLVWGFGCVLIVDVLHPILAGLVALIPGAVSAALLSVFSAAFIADLIQTVITVGRLNVRLESIDETTRALRRISDSIGENVAENAAAAAERGRERGKELRERGDELRRDMEERRGELAERAGEARAALEAENERLRARYSELSTRLSAGERRLVHAFPELRSKLHSEVLEELKRLLETRTRRR